MPSLPIREANHDENYCSYEARSSPLRKSFRCLRRIGTVTHERVVAAGGAVVVHRDRLVREELPGELFTTAVLAVLHIRFLPRVR